MELLPVCSPAGAAFGIAPHITRIPPHRGDRVTFSRAGRAGSLTASETDLLNQLQRPSEPEKLLLFNDPGRNGDELTTLILAAALQKRGFIDIRAVISSVEPAIGRALLSKGSLQTFGLDDIPVGVGAEVPLRRDRRTEWLNTPFIPKLSRKSFDEDDTVENGQALLERTLSTAKKHHEKLTLVLIANMADLNRFLHRPDGAVDQEHLRLFEDTVKKVVIMGGVQQSSDETDTNATGLTLDQGYLQASTSATNNNRDQDAANFIYRQVQESNIPLTVVTREAAKVAPLSPHFFRDMTGTPMTTHLQEVEKIYYNEFWQAACSPQGAGGPKRNREWFINNYCDPNKPLPQGLNASDDIYPFLKGLTPFDPLTLLAAVDPLTQRTFRYGKQEIPLFQPVSLIGPDGQTVHQIIGLSQRETGVPNPKMVSILITALAKEVMQESAVNSAIN